ncbi:hypothetical protein SLEP1_g30686 [Rubroshorea leprosula]|uniref:Uncharacterized protein n=1 Tax=Rubroshorea leprosula TaxID=152421 RepID=A0AAV5K6G1_9ROSI|nr:hypothetical protein SLEP1_g30686 [Rubroshorea leprosula]
MLSTSVTLDQHLMIRLEVSMVFFLISKLYFIFST